MYVSGQGLLVIIVELQSCLGAHLSSRLSGSRAFSRGEKFISLISKLFVRSTNHTLLALSILASHEMFHFSLRWNWSMLHHIASD